MPESRHRDRALLLVCVLICVVIKGAQSETAGGPIRVAEAVHLQRYPKRAVLSGVSLFRQWVFVVQDGVNIKRLSSSNHVLLLCALELDLVDFIRRICDSGQYHHLVRVERRLTVGGILGKRLKDACCELMSRRQSGASSGIRNYEPVLGRGQDRVRVAVPDVQNFEPWSLSSYHLLFNRLDAALCGSGLFVCDSKLLFDLLGGFDRICRSLLGLGIQDRGLRLHFSELAVKDEESYEANEETGSGDNDHPPVGIKKPFVAILWLAIGLAMDIFAMWLIRIRSKRSNSGREWLACIVVALLILSASLFPITHGTNLLLGI